MSLRTSLSMHGVALIPWRLGGGLDCFSFGTMDGLLDLREGLLVIALHNDKPGNGDFALLIKTFEEVATDHSYEVTVVQLWNQNLARWFERRGYTLSDDTETGYTATKHFLAAQRVKIKARMESA